MEIKKKCARWFSHRGALALIMALIAAMPVSAQSAKQILDKAAAVVSAKQGAQADFTINGITIFKDRNQFINKSVHLVPSLSVFIITQIY